MGRLDELDWAMPTDLAGWSVHDVVAHCAALESELLGTCRCASEIDKTAPHIRMRRAASTPSEA